MNDLITNIGVALGVVTKPIKTCSKYSCNHPEKGYYYYLLAY